MSPRTPWTCTYWDIVTDPAGHAWLSVHLRHERAFLTLSRVEGPRRVRRHHGPLLAISFPISSELQAHWPR